MKPTALRWGILGVAHINRRLMPAFAAAVNAELRAIASRSADRARQAAADAHVPHAYGNYEALLDDPHVDAVYIPLPNDLHAEWTRKAAERGKHVLCEKPLCPTAAQAQSVVDYCRERNVKLMDGFMWPHHPRTARLKHLFEGGGLGELRRVAAAFTFRMDPLDPANIRLQADRGGGSLLDVGCYPVYAIRWAFGAEPEAVFATARYEHGVDVEMNGELWFSGGRMGGFDCGFTLPYRTWLEAVGTNAGVCVTRMWLPEPAASYLLERDGKPAEKVVLPEADQIVLMVEYFGRAVLEDLPVSPPPEEAVKTLRVLEALARSARERRMVRFEGDSTLS
jgi:predicted dehydrogenase